MAGQKDHRARRMHGFSLIELLVALAVFATMAATAWGALNSIVHTRSEIAHEEDELRALMATIDALQRDLRQAVARPVRGNYGEPVASFIGASDRLEFTRMGFANPLAELRSNLERVGYALDGRRLQRASYPVLDRAPNTHARSRVLRDGVDAFRLRYLDAQQRWVGEWPEPNANAGDPVLPRAVEVRLDTTDYGEITTVVELVADFRDSALAPARAAAP